MIYDPPQWTTEKTVILVSAMALLPLVVATHTSSLMSNLASVILDLTTPTEIRSPVPVAASHTFILSLFDNFVSRTYGKGV